MKMKVNTSETGPSDIVDQTQNSLNAIDKINSIDNSLKKINNVEEQQKLLKGFSTKNGMSKVFTEVFDDPLLFLKLNPNISEEQLQNAIGIWRDFEEAYKGKEKNFGRTKFGPLHMPLEVIEAFDIAMKIYQLKGSLTEEQYNKLIIAFRSNCRLGAFKDCQYDIVRLNKGTKIYRKGDEEHSLGSFWTLNEISLNTKLIRQDLAMRRFWPNYQSNDLHFAKLVYAYEYELTKDVFAIFGNFSQQGELYIGNPDIIQYFIPWNCIKVNAKFISAKLLQDIEK